MRKSLLALLAFAPLAFAQTQTLTYSYGGVPIPIYPDDWNVIAVARIFVPRSISITNISAAVQVQFSGVGDLNVYLYSPLGTRTKLLERNCGGLVNIDSSFTDNAYSKYSDYCPSTAGQGPFQGNEPLGNSYGQNAYGYWRLAVENNGSSKNGFLTGFSITITGNSLGSAVIGPNTILSASSFQGGPVTPGDQIGILGVNLGPTDGVRASAGSNLPTSLAGTSVTFDGVSAPIYYVSDKLVVAQAPPLTPGTPTAIQVVSAAGASPVVSVQVVATKPGIQTVESLGRGQAKATNDDGSANGDGSANSSKPAAAGSIIKVLATGLGPVNPAIAQGTVTPSSPQSVATLPVTATVGGLTAESATAIAAPGTIGVYEVSIKLPSRLRAGAHTIAVDAGGASSQEGVTVQIK